MHTASFSLYVLYSQICIFYSSLAQPFNEWLQVHVDQGFAWRPGSVSFRTLEEEGTHSVDLVVSEQPLEVSNDAVRVIEVPFEVPAGGEIEVASISDATPLSLPQGRYALRCEFFEKSTDGVLRVRLVFALSASCDFQVIRADKELNVPLKLASEAAPAT